MQRIRTFAQFALKKYPILSNSVIYGTLCVTAEFSQQTLNKKFLAEVKEPYDWDIIKRYSIYGTCIAGPLLTVWYSFLDKKISGTAPKLIIKKVLIDQFTFTFLLLVVFYTSMSIMEGKKDIFEECRNKILPTYKTSCMFWMPVQSINFGLIPPYLRVSFISVASYIWVNILCWLKRQSPEKEIEN